MKYKTEIEVLCEAPELLGLTCTCTTRVVLAQQVEFSTGNLGIGAFELTPRLDLETSKFAAVDGSAWLVIRNSRLHPPLFICPEHKDAALAAVDNDEKNRTGIKPEGTNG